MLESQYLRNIGLYVVFSFCGLHGADALAQRPGGGGSPDGFFRFLDRNQDGKIDAEEAARIPAQMREGLERSGVDLRRGVDAQQFSRVMEQARQDRERSGGGSPSFGGPPSSGGDRRDFGRGDSGRGDSSRSSGGSEEDRRREFERRREEAAKSATPATPKIIPLKPRERVTVDLPSTFVAGDTDLDGQISLYEWRQWKRGSLDEFYAYDADGDGFLTPQELKNGPATTVAKQQVVIVSNNGVPATPAGTSVVTSVNATASPTSSSGGASGGDTSSAAYKRGESMFRILDRNRDGNVNPDEWGASSRLKPMFEKAAIDLTTPMPRETFLTHYVKLSETGS